MTRRFFAALLTLCLLLVLMPATALADDVTVVMSDMIKDGVITLDEGEYTLEGSDIENPERLTIRGKHQSETTLYFGTTEGYTADGEGGSECHFRGTELTVKNCALRDVNYSGEGSAALGNQSFAGAKSLCFEGCSFNSLITYAAEEDVTFNSCVFDFLCRDDYAICICGDGTYTFNNCSFTVANRVFNIYSEEAITPSVNLNGCVFTYLEGPEPVFNISDNATATVTIMACSKTEGAEWYTGEGSIVKVLNEEMFTDISGSGYRYYITAAADAGLVNGYPDGTFRPNASVSRAQFITMLWRAAGSPEAENAEFSFADAESVAEPFRAAVAWSTENGIIKGYADGTFRPNSCITRAQMATFIYRLVVACHGKDLPAKLKTPYGFVDESQISAPYVDAVNTIANLKIMQGVDDAPTFDPNGTATRGMAAAVLYRIMHTAF